MHPSNVVTAWVLDSHDALTDAVRAAALDPRELSALTLIAEYPGRSIEWLRVRIGLTQSGTVRLVDRLEASKLVRRERTDGRTVALFANAEAQSRLSRWHQVRDEAVEALLAGLPRETRDALVAHFADSLQRRPRRRRDADAKCRACDWPACGEDCPVAASIVDAE